MNKLKTFFYSLKGSLFEPKYYHDVAKVKFWFSFKYLWFLLFFFVVFKGVFLGGQYLINRPRIQPDVNRLVIFAENFYPKDLELEINKGQLSTNVREPYVIDLEKNQQSEDQRHLLIIDTKGSIENYPNYNTYVLATKNAVVYPSKSRNYQISETGIFYFRNIKDKVFIDKKFYNDIINKIKPYAAKVTYFVDLLVIFGLLLFLLFGSLFWALAIMFGLLFLTLLVLIVNLLFKRGYKYGSLFKIGMHVVTWPIIITEILKYFRWTVPGIYPIMFFIIILIILFSKLKHKTA